MLITVSNSVMVENVSGSVALTRNGTVESAFTEEYSEP